MADAALKPTDLVRRSNLYRVLDSLGAQYEEVNGFACAMSFGDAGEASAAGNLGIADLSALPRAGYKGWDMATWVTAQGISLGEPNTATVQADGSLACRLSAGELLMLGGLNGASDTIDQLAGVWSMADAVCFPVPRADTNFCLALSGRHIPEMMAKMCGIDLRPQRFVDGAIAQTSVARMNAILVRHDLGATYCLLMVADSASAVYMWECLTDAMAEFDGRPVGLTSLRSLTQSA
ncbi:MAG: sarcosine oxidase [Pseudomonadota bacterium]